jgi:hypothetical protein
VAEEAPMKRKRFTEEQIVAVLQESTASSRIQALATAC